MTKTGQDYLDRFPIIKSCEVCYATEPVEGFVELATIRLIVNEASFPRRWQRILARVLRIDRTHYACGPEHAKVVLTRMRKG